MRFHINRFCGETNFLKEGLVTSVTFGIKRHDSRMILHVSTLQSESSYYQQNNRHCAFQTSSRTRSRMPYSSAIFLHFSTSDSGIVVLTTLNNTSGTYFLTSRAKSSIP